MDAERDGHLLNQPRRRRRKATRRRLRDRAPISAHLVLDQHFRGDVGILSDDLVTDLFPGLDLAGKSRINELFGATILMKL